MVFLLFMVELLKAGLGCHHAGLVMTDRNLIESAFRDGLIPVLIATSTLGMIIQQHVALIYFSFNNHK